MSVVNSLWHLKSVEEVFHELSSFKHGITDGEASKRLRIHGKNTLERDDPLRIFKLILKQINNILIYVLIGACVVAYYLQDYIEFVGILFIIFITVFLSFLQEYSADRTIKAISKLSAKKIDVLRDGIRKTILAEDLVVGDVVILTRGVIIPADIRVIECKGLLVDESILTGESRTRAKMVDSMSKQDIPISEQDNMGFAGTAVSSGSGIGIVVRVGLSSEIGKISSTIRRLENKKSPLQVKVDQMSTQVSIMILVLCALLFIILILNRFSFPIAMLLIGSVVVAGIPESFPLSLTLALSKGVKRMAKENAIVKNLSSVETLGTTTVICTDKTGTLTENRMLVKKIMLSDKTELTVHGKAYEPSNQIHLHGKLIDNKFVDQYTHFFEACVLCNDSNLDFKENAWVLSGEPTEGALLTLGKSANVNDELLREVNKRVYEIPFDPKTKIMVTVHHNTAQKKCRLYLKGAGERVLDRCSYYLNSKGKKLKINSSVRKYYDGLISTYTSEGLRVLAIASKESKCGKDLLKNKRKLEEEFVLEGIVGIEDPIRKEVFGAIEECKSAGIDVIMITGDHSSTAKNIGEQLKIITLKRKLILEATDIDRMNDDELDAVIGKVAIFARMTPDHKLRIVSSLQRKGEIVAMTGDGVNDAPALKKADIGISMGKLGTEVAREASDMILRDDNFKTIVQAIKEGRTIYSNIRRFIYYLLTASFAQVGIILFAVLLGFSDVLPLTPLMILYINFVTSTFPALALSIEPTHKKVMLQLPRSPNEKLLSDYIITKIAVITPTMIFSALILFLWELRVVGSSLEKAMTIAFAVMVVSGALHTFNARRLHTTLFDDGFFKNKYVFWSVLVSIFFTILTIHTEWGRRIFETVELSMFDWGLVFLFGALIIVVSEIIKLSTKQELEEHNSLHGTHVRLE